MSNTQVTTKFIEQANVGTVPAKKTKKIKKKKIRIGLARGRSFPAPRGAWAAMPPSHWSLGPQGGGSGRTLVRPACAYAEDHAD